MTNSYGIESETDDYRENDCSDMMGKATVPIKDGQTLKKIGGLVMENNDTFITCCPINNTCLEFFGTNFFGKLYMECKCTTEAGLKVDCRNAEVKKYHTANFIVNRIESCALTEKITERGAYKWQSIIC